jgi:DNA-directed RNA polymerase subunit RPC12/RpoP
MLLTCVCGQTNRVPSLPKNRIRCGKCKREFTPRELARAKPEAPPPPFSLDNALDDVDATHACKDEENCGWEGVEEDLDEDGKCPDCGKRVKKIS